MAVKQSQFFKGNARTPIGHATRANEVTEHLFTHTFTEAVTTADILELFPLLPNGRIVAFEVAGSGLSTTTFKVGFMSGNPGELDDARTLGSELASTLANASGVVGLATLAPLAGSGVARSIGIQPSANIAASGSTVLHVRIRVKT